MLVRRTARHHPRAIFPTPQAARHARATWHQEKVRDDQISRHIVEKSIVEKSIVEKSIVEKSIVEKSIAVQEMNTTTIGATGARSPFDRQAPARFAGLTSAVDIADRQARTEALEDAIAHGSSLAGMTLRSVLMDIGEAMDGVPRDFVARGPRAPLRDVVLRKDRLRGIGLVLVLAAFVIVAMG